jgi:hypothetical protein
MIDDYDDYTDSVIHDFIKDVIGGPNRWPIGVFIARVVAISFSAPLLYLFYIVVTKL